MVENIHLKKTEMRKEKDDEKMQTHTNGFDAGHLALQTQQIALVYIDLRL